LSADYRLTLAAARGASDCTATTEETMAYETILLDREDGVGIITLNRPESLNAMNRKLGAELSDAMAQLNGDDTIGCIVITGSGEKAFSAGGDIKEQLADDKRYTQEELDRMSNPRRSYDIAASPKPTIGMMNGLAYGGAAVLASSLDMRIGCEGTRFRFLAAAYGRINSTWSLGCQIGWPMAKELLFSARIVEAEEAYRLGLLNHLVPRTQLRTKTMELAKMIAGNHRGAVMGVKALLLKQKGESQEAQWAAEYEYTTKVMRGAKAKDAFPEFLARKGLSAA
jgi:enoyl-CoA hydratase